MGVVQTQKECVDMCCKSKKCDIAMTVGRECINIKCFNKKNCNVAPAGSQALYRDVLPVTTFVQHADDSGGIDRRSESKCCSAYNFLVGDCGFGLIIKFIL